MKKATNLLLFVCIISSNYLSLQAKSIDHKAQQAIDKAIIEFNPSDEFQNENETMTGTYNTKTKAALIHQKGH